MSWFRCHLSCLLFLLIPEVAAAWLGMCAPDPAQAGVRVVEVILKPAGTAVALVATDERLRDCAMSKIPVAKERIQWAKVIPRAAAAALSGGVILKGTGDGARFTANEVIPLKEQARAPAPPATAAERMSPAPVRATPGRALWVWQPEAWRVRPGELFGLLAANAADTVFVTVPVTADRTQVADPGALERFVTHASARDFRVWVVAGDARAVLPAERTGYAERARAYADYNRSVAAEARLSGLQLDIEPYLNPGYGIDIEGWLAAYLDTLAQVRAQAAMPLDVALPFWWGRQPYRGGMFLDHLTPLVDVVTVMNYRTDRRQLLDFAEPFLAWAARAQRSVRIGLETGPIPDEALRVYRGSREGELWLVPLQENVLVVLLDEPRVNPAGSAFAYSHTTPWRGNSITFRSHLPALRELLPQLEAAWSGWPSFAGVALHGLDAP